MQAKYPSAKCLIDKLSLCNQIPEAYDDIVIKDQRNARSVLDFVWNCLELKKFPIYYDKPKLFHTELISNQESAVHLKVRFDRPQRFKY